MKKLLVTALVSFLAFNTDAQSNPSQSLYGEVSLGKNLFYSAADEIRGNIEGYGFNISSGFKLTENIAGEIGHMRNAEKVDFKNSVNTTFVAARFQLPLTNDVNLITKLGFMRVNTGDEHLRLPFMGIGAGYKLNDKMQATIMYQGGVYGIGGAGLLGLGLNYSL